MIVLTILPGIRYGEVRRRNQKEFCSFAILTVPWGEHNTPCRTTWGSTDVGCDAEGEKGTVGKCLYYGFCGKEWVKHDKQV